MKKFAKILSILCTLALIASCISVGFVASAAEATMSYTDYDTFNAQTSYDVYGANRLAGATVSANATEIIDGVPTAAGSWTPGTGLTDNSPAAQQMIQVTWPSGAANAATDSTSTNQYLDYTFALPSGVNNPEMVLLAFVQTNTNVNWDNTFFDCRHWAIYASDSAETLYSGEPIYYRQQSGQTAPEYKVDISGLELKNVKYLGVRVYNFYFWGNTVLFSEIGLYGGKAVFQGNPEPTSDDYVTRFGSNWLTTSSYVTTESVDGVVGTPKSVLSSIAVDNLWSTGRCMYQSANGMNADNNEAGQTDTYFQTTFTLAAPINDPETALIAWANSNGAQPDKVSQESHHYEIFASDKLEDLYTKSIYEHNVSSDLGWEHVIDISNKDLKGIKYFGIRIYHRPPAIWNSIVVVTEIGLYGGKSILTDSATYSDDENDAYNYGANRLAGSTATTTTTLIGSDGNATISKGADVAILTDGSTASRNQIQAANIWDSSYSFSKASTDKYIQVTFALKKVVNNPSKFLIAHDQAFYESNPTVNQWYEIFASDTEADLYENSIFVYKNASAKKVEQQLDLSGMNLGNVKYFGIRFYHVPTGCFALPSEIALYGGEAVPTASITTGYQNYSKGSAYTAYGQNHLEYAIGEAIATNGTDTVAANVALGSVDGKFTDSGTIAAGDGLNENKEAVLTEANNGLDQTAAYLQLQYTLNAPVDNPQKFVFIHHNSVSGSFNSAHYAVFASDSLETLYDKALYEFKADAGVGNTHVIDISEFELQNVKYAAIRLYHRAYNNCNQHIEEFGLYGGTMEAGFDTNSTAAFPNTSWGSNNILKGKEVSAVSDNGSSVVPFEDTDKDDYLAGFTDDKTANDGTGAKYIPGLEQGGSFKVTYDLGGTLNNPTTVNFQAGWGVAKPYTVYASATLEDLYNAENAIVEVAGYTGGIVYRNITTDITEKNLTGIKYIGLKVDATNNTMIHITEFAVKGGTYTEDPKEPEVSISLGASVFASTAGQNANDITYRLNVTSDSTIVDMGIISGFKVNIDADAGFQPDAKPEEYAEYLKTAPATAVKVSATAEQLTNENLYFHVTNSGTAGTADYSGYKLVTIAYVTVEFEGEEYTYYSNVIIKSSKQISRNQARDYYNLGGEYKEIADTVFAGYDFTKASTDINKVREYVETVS